LQVRIEAAAALPDSLDDRLAGIEVVAEMDRPEAGDAGAVADRWFPSSKTCSDCGHVVPTLPLSVRDWVCPACGSVHDRNAAINLMNIAASSAVTACGAGSSDGGLAPVVKLSAMKQELSHGSFVHD
jgi:hypothetical protein